LKQDGTQRLNMLSRYNTLLPYFQDIEEEYIVQNHAENLAIKSLLSQLKLVNRMMMTNDLQKKEINVAGFLLKSILIL
jgi:hypothetical protein